MTYEAFINEWENGKPTLTVQTSGSTGTPKQLQVKKEYMRASARLTCDFLHLQPGDTALLCMSLDYIGGKMMVVRSLVRSLELIITPPCGHPLSRIDRPITFAAMVPLQVFNSLQVPEERKKLMAVRHLIIGGGAVDKRLLEALKDFPNNVWSTYGMTETLSHIALRRLNGYEASEWYTPFHGIELWKDRDNCLNIHAPMIADCVLQTHDIVEFKSEKKSEKCKPREFRIIGRLDNVINSGGIKIQIELLEEQLKEFIPYPLMIARRKDPKFGEMVTLLIEQPPTSVCRDSPATYRQLLYGIKTACQTHLSPYHVPKIYRIVNRLPVTATNKPNRALADRMMEEADMKNEEQRGRIVHERP